MTKDEVLKLALEALEEPKDHIAKHRRLEAITAIKEALAQPPQRTWVGLTDEEYAELAEEFGPFPINQIEAKLKEKNT